MILRKSFFLFLLIFLSFSFGGVPYWIKAIGLNYEDSAIAIKQTADGNIAVAGYTIDSNGNVDFWIMKIDTQGNILWQKTYNLKDIDYIYSMDATSDGGLILTGYSDLGQNQEIWILKLDSNGNVVWEKLVSGSSNDVGISIHETSDGGYILAADTNSFGAGLNDVLVIKFDQNGNAIWQKTYGLSGKDVVSSIKETSDGGYVITGYTDSFGVNENIFVIKVDSSGNIIWQYIYDSNGIDFSEKIIETQDGNYLVIGYTLAAGGTTFDLLVFKLDTNGNILWQKVYDTSFNVYVNSAIETSDGGYLITGNIYQGGTGNGFLIKLDKDGIPQWAKVFDSGSEDGLWDTTEIPGEGYVLAGYTLQQSTNLDFLVIKTNYEVSVSACSSYFSDITISSNTINLSRNQASFSSLDITPTHEQTVATVADTSASETELCYEVISLSPTLYVIIEGEGKVISNPAGISCGNDCSESFNENTEVLLKAIPGEGYIFDTWTGDCSECGQNENCSLIMNSNKTCTAVFIPVAEVSITNGNVVESRVITSEENLPAPPPENMQIVCGVIEFSAELNPGENTTEVLITYNTQLVRNLDNYKVYKWNGEEWVELPNAVLENGVLKYTLTDNSSLDLDPNTGRVRDPVAVMTIGGKEVNVPLRSGCNSVNGFTLATLFIFLIKIFRLFSHG